MRVAIIGELHGMNLGEPLLFDCIEFLLKEMDETMEICRLDFFGREKKTNCISQKRGVPFLYIGVKILRKISEMIGVTPIMLRELEWKLGYDRSRIRKYLEEKLTMARPDGIIVSGAGSLKYDVRLNFAPYYSLLIETAEKLGLPVYINGIGVESKFDPKDRRCKMFVKCLNKNAVKMITTRDQIEELRKYISNRRIECWKVADAGCWAAETFGISKKNDSECIGIGAITPIRFKEFGRSTYKKYEELLMNIIHLLDQKGIQWRIFNNGDACDIAFANELCRKLGKPVNEYVRTPKEPRELVEIISSFKSIITSRLHSCIVAYSLNIPFVAIAWNNKLKLWANEIGIADRIMEDNLNEQEIVSMMEHALLEGYHMQHRAEYRQSAKTALQKYIQSMKEIGK